jgi:hypothetical protein
MRNFLLFFSLTLLLGACELFPEAEPENVLPPITQEGANTFGCKVNGEVWLPYKDGGFISLTGDALDWEASETAMFLSPINERDDFLRKVLLDLNPKEKIQEGRVYHFNLYDEVDSIRRDTYSGGGGHNLIAVSTVIILTKTIQKAG